MDRRTFVKWVFMAPVVVNLTEFASKGIVRHMSPLDAEGESGKILVISNAVPTWENPIFQYPLTPVQCFKSINSERLRKNSLFWNVT